MFKFFSLPVSCAIHTILYVPCSFLPCSLLPPSTVLASAEAWKQIGGFHYKELPIQYFLHNLYVQQGEITSIIPWCHFHSYNQLLFPKGNSIFISKLCLFCTCLPFPTCVLGCVPVFRKVSLKAFLNWSPIFSLLAGCDITG